MPSPVPDLVSVVIPAYNATELIDEQLNALAAQDYAGRFEVIVSDNGSTDGLARHLENYPHAAALALRLIDSSNTPGVAHARNVGVAQSKGQVIAFADADDRVHPGWLSAMVQACSRFDAVGGTLETASLNSADIASWRPLPASGTLPTIPGYLPVTPGCSFAALRSLIDDLGGWNEEFSGSGEDFEFCIRLQLRGFTLGQAPDAITAYRLRNSYLEHWRQNVAGGRADAKLYANFRDHGMPRRSPIALADTIAYVVFRNPLIPKKIRRNTTGMWLFHLANLYGRVRGSIENRVYYL